jgi:protein-disulfide isomerase/uncharacterized membrane protein
MTESNQQRSITLQGLTGLHAVHILISLGMIFVSFYLTTHFYAVRFPTQLGAASSLCDISSFWNCDAATHSKAAEIMGVPTSIFGLIVGVLFFFSSLMPSEAQEKTCSAVSKYNFIGCVGLFFFSIIQLGSLCPMCSVYYVLSGLACFNYFKFGINSWMPDLKISLIWTGILAVTMGLTSMQTQEKATKQNLVNVSIVEQFKALPDLGDPDQDSPYVIHQVGNNFKSAPLRLTIFSDFQCPFCKIVAEQMPKLIRRYKDKLAIQYMFYPLDSSCNSSVKHKMHDRACQAAMISACKPDIFVTVHDEIFANQDKLSSGALEEIAKKYQLTDCMQSEEMKNKVIAIINQASKYDIQSTPTLILNGKKIEGSIVDDQFQAIFDSILAEAK